MVPFLFYKHTYLTKSTLKFPAAKSKPWFSVVARPKPTVRTDKDRVSSRPRTNKMAHMVKLEDKRMSMKLQSRSSQINISHSFYMYTNDRHKIWCVIFQTEKQNDNSPYLSVLVAEIDQAGNVEEKFNKVVQHQQDQTQTVQTERDTETRFCFQFVSYCKSCSLKRLCTNSTETLHLPHICTCNSKLSKWAVLTSECRHLRCGPGTGRCTQAVVEYPPKQWTQRMGGQKWSKHLQEKSMIFF